MTLTLWRSNGVSILHLHIIKRLTVWRVCGVCSLFNVVQCIHGVYTAYSTYIYVDRDRVVMVVS